MRLLLGWGWLSDAVEGNPHALKSVSAYSRHDLPCGFPSAHCRSACGLEIEFKSHQGVTSLTPLPNSEWGTLREGTVTQPEADEVTGPGSQFSVMLWFVRMGIMSLMSSGYLRDSKPRCKSSYPDSEIWNKAWMNKVFGVWSLKYTEV